MSKEVEQSKLFANLVPDDVGVQNLGMSRKLSNMKASQIIEEEQLSEIPNVHPIVLYELVHRLKKNGSVSWKDLIEVTSRESNTYRM